MPANAVRGRKETSDIAPSVNSQRGCTCSREAVIAPARKGNACVRQLIPRVCLPAMDADDNRPCSVNDVN